MNQETKVFVGLRLFFSVCFGISLLCVVTVYYPLAGMILFLMGLTFLVSKGGAGTSNKFGVLLFLLSLLIHLGVVAVVTTPIESDFAVQYEAAQKFAQGDFSFQNDRYFQRWGYQTGLVIWEGVLLKLWNNPLLLRLVNCVVSAGTNVLIYLIARDYFEDWAARVAALAYAFFLFPATLVTVLCNSIPSAFFLYLCLYLVMGKRFEKLPRLAAYALAGLSLAVANALRPDAPLVLVPLLAYFVFRFLSKASWNHFFHYLKRFGALLITFLVVSAGMSGMVKIAGINSIGLTNQDPLWSIVLGTNTETGGTFTYDDSNAVVALTDQGMERSQAEIQVIKEHLQVSPFKLVETLVRKMKTLWWDRGLGWALGSVRESSPTLYALLEEIDRAMFTCALFLAALGALALFRRPRKDFKLYLLPFIFFATCCVYLVMEVQPRYAYVGQIALFVMMAGGLQEICSFWKTLTGKWRADFCSRERFLPRAGK